MRPTSVLIGRAKNEALYLLDWIAYHRAIGFDAVTVFSNPSVDGTQELLDALAQEGVVSHVRFELGPTQSPDREMIAAAVAYAKTLEKDWLCLLDIDEFLVLEKHADVGDFLAGFEGADGVAVNWAVFGSSDLTEYDDRPAIERFLHRAPLGHPINRWVKSFGRSKAVAGCGAHHFRLRGGAQPYMHAGGKPFTSYNDAAAIDHSAARIHHYSVRTPEEYVLKRRRGDGAVKLEMQEQINRYDDGHFKNWNRNDEYDDAILKFTEGRRALVDRWGKLPGVRKALRTARAQIAQMRQEAAEAAPKEPGSGG